MPELFRIIAVGIDQDFCAGLGDGCPFLFGRTQSAAIENKLRRLRRKAEALQLRQGHAEDAVELLLDLKGTLDSLRPESGSQRQRQPGELFGTGRCCRWFRQRCWQYCRE